MRFATLLMLMVSASWVLADEASIATGKKLYGQTCIACHGANGRGAIPGVADLTKRDGALAKSDDELMKNITKGLQNPGSMLAMPAKGGNPTLSDADVQALLVYLRSEFGS
ncbi:MAG: cytochrome c [Gammaproteobacteria bacterium]|nr:cytochrome c [Gammaproteobacteria bacterium]